MDPLKSKVAVALLKEGYTLSQVDDNGWSLIHSDAELETWVKMRIEDKGNEKYVLHVMIKHPNKVSNRWRRCKIGKGYLDYYTSLHRYRSARCVAKVIQAAIAENEAKRVANKKCDWVREEEKKESIRSIEKMKELGLDKLNEEMDAFRCVGSYVKQTAYQDKDGVTRYRDDAFQLSAEATLSPEAIFRISEIIKEEAAKVADAETLLVGT